jgi:nucleoside phosphorylase
MADRRLKTSDYTVGLICALRIELAAVELLLDETHQDFPQGLNDADFYSFGRIGEHNVVIACLHDGNLGITSAATAASQMVSEFPSIRFAMLVGIGGGVPREDTDIRLGDVVISLPQMQHGGLVQYDLEKTAGEGRLMRTGSLNIPPPIHLYALSKFRSKGIRGLVNLSTHLSALAHLPEFVYQGADSDTLYKATYSHAGGSTCEGCSRDELVLRDPRKISGVSLHFGTIASGNQVLKDGVTRDRLSKELGDVLCVEMEAAGLIDNFPCLVIRGICDYADSHKNTRWQAYAAATAAACAKELLGTVPASELLSASSLYEDSFTPVPSLIDDSGSSLGGVSHVAQKEFAALFKHELIKAVTLRPTLKQPTLKYSLLVELLRGYASIKSLSASPGMQEIAVRLVGRQAARISTLFLEDIQPGAYPAPNISFDHLRKYLAPSSMDKVRVWNPDDAAPPDLDTDQSTETMEDKAELEELPVEFEPVRTFLISGDPFVSLVTNIQKHLLDEGSDILWDIRTTVVATLEARRLRFGSKIAARFHVAWDLVDYMRTQFRDGQDIHKILTLSGSSDYAQALSCEEYISYHWPSIGQALLGAVQSILLRGGNIEKVNIIRSISPR